MATVDNSGNTPLGGGFLNSPFLIPFISNGPHSCTDVRESPVLVLGNFYLRSAVASRGGEIIIC